MTTTANRQPTEIEIGYAIAKAHEYFCEMGGGHTRFCTGLVDVHIYGGKSGEPDRFYAYPRVPTDDGGSVTTDTSRLLVSGAILDHPTTPLRINGDHAC